MFFIFLTTSTYLPPIFLKMGSLKFSALIIATIIVTVQTFLDVTIFLCRRASIGSLLSVDSKETRDAAWGHVDPHQGGLKSMLGVIGRFKISLPILRGANISKERGVVFGCVVPAIRGPPGAPSVLQMFRSSSAPERSRSKHTLPSDRGHFAMPYALIASPHIHNLPFLSTTFTFFADIADQRPHHIHKFRNELCLWDSGANITHVPRHRVPLEIRRLASENLVDIRISFNGAPSPEITTQALMLDVMPNGTEFFVLGQQDLIECISHHFIPRSFLPVSPMPVEATYGMLNLIRYYNPRTQSSTYFH